MRPVISLTAILTDELEADVTQLSTIVYNLSEKESTDEKFIKKLSLDGASEEDLNKKSNEKPLRQNRDQGEKKKIFKKIFSKTHGANRAIARNIQE